jgi:hypothetical protein
MEKRFVGVKRASAADKIHGGVKSRKRRNPSSWREVVTKLKFRGGYEKLQECVSRTGLRGKWRDLKYGQKQYRTARGGVLNWWQTTGTITFQGLKAMAREKLEEAFIASAKKYLIGEYDGRAFCGWLRSLYPDDESR